MRCIARAVPNSTPPTPCSRFDRHSEAALSSRELWRRRFFRSSLSPARVVSPRGSTEPDRKNRSSERSVAHLVFTFVHGTGSTAVSGNCAARNPQTAIYRRSAAQRYHPPAHPARGRSGTPGSAHLGSNDAIPADLRRYETTDSARNAKLQLSQLAGTHISPRARRRR